MHDVLRSPGQPLDAGVRAFMEPRFGRDLGDVRVHTDAKAAKSASAIAATAYTVGRDIVFGAGEYGPHNRDGRILLAHELVHVGQQRRGAGSARSIIRRRTVRHNYATATSERGPLCNVRLAITGAPASDTENLRDFINAAQDGIRAACGSLPHELSRAIRVTISYRQGMEYSDVQQRAYIAARISVLGRAADPDYIAEQEQIAHVAQLDSNYREAVRIGDWQMAAEHLNGFNNQDIASRVGTLNLTQVGELRHGAVTNPRLGGGERLVYVIDVVRLDARRVADLIHGYESALAALDWETAAEYLNGFSDADIRVRLGRLQRIQLGALRDGAIRNLRLGRGARLVGLIDGVTAPPLLSGVGAACFDGATITVTKNRVSHSCPAFTGSVGDPTPNGRFCIRMQGQAIIAGGLTGRLLQDREVWFLLEPQFPTTRFKMILHPGTRSSGCITVNDRACFDQLAAVLNLPGLDTGRGYDGYPPGNSAGVLQLESSVDCVAWLDVTTRGGCGP